MAEELAAAHMRLIGFADARRTREGADGGLDVSSNGAVAQVKNLAAPVGSPDIQRARGAAHGTGVVLFYSSSGFTDSAVSVAELCEIALFRYTESGDVEPVNERAAAMANPQSALAELLDLARECLRLRLRAMAWLDAVQRDIDDATLVATEGTHDGVLGTVSVNTDPEVAERLETKRPMFEGGFDYTQVVSVGLTPLYERSVGVRDAVFALLDTEDDVVVPDSTALASLTSELRGLDGDFNLYRDGIEASAPWLIDAARKALTHRLESSDDTECRLAREWGVTSFSL